MTLSKRDLLKGIAATAAIGALPPSGASAGVAELARNLSGGFSSLESALAIGQLALSRACLPSSASELQELLRASMDRAVRRGGSRGERWRDLQQAVRCDFAEGRTIDVDGWVLARSEVAACALLKLLDQPASA